MFQSQDQLCDVELGTLLREPGLALQMPEEFTARFEIGDEVQVGVCLEGELETDEERRLKRSLQDLALADGVGDLLLRDDLALGEDFHGIDSLGVPLADLEDSAESASSNEFEELEVAWSERSLGLENMK
jgi:hypothetical protein